MPLQLSSQLSRLVRRDNRGQAPLNASVAPASPSIDSDPDYNEPNVPTVVVDTDNSVFNGLNWARVLHFERRSKDYAKGLLSWIYLYS
jgi:hypothetical protein